MKDSTLLGFGARNFYSFKEGVEISFELSGNCPPNISKGKNVSNLISVQGANGSGKTCALKILSFLNFFCTNSFNEKPDSELQISSFFSNNDPIDIYCEFIIDGIKYDYFLSINKTEVLKEELSRTVNSSRKVFERYLNVITKRINEFSDLDAINLRSNASLISTANQYNETNTTSKIYDFFNNISSNVGWYGRDNSSLDYAHVSKYYKNNSKAFAFTKRFIAKSDLGINNISIHKSKDQGRDDYFFPIFTHDVDSDHNRLTIFDESSGTRELFAILPHYEYILRTGGVLVLDEFDVNLHPDILPSLIKLFDNKETNPNNAQMIFSTHNDNIMDYMGKYRIVLVNKENCESYAYRLDEIPSDILRNNRSILRVYNEGKIGGVPRI